MCGIAGIFSPGRPLDLRLLQAMTQSLAHRGPDGEGYVLLAAAGNEKPLAVRGPLVESVRGQEPAYALGLGHRRLAIVDLTAMASQPMGTHDGRVWLTYNGEVYNAPELRRELADLGHVFRSSSDTEVVLAAYRQWGEASLPRFNGMFAFALWDGRAGTLFCARDRLGIKPFYYRQDGDRFLFASEIKALLQDPSCPRRPNDPALYDYLTVSRLDHTTETLFQGIHQLAPGEWLKVRFAGEGRPLSLQHGRWWQIPVGHNGHDRQNEMEPREAAAGLRGLLEDSIRLQLRADVPIGSCLSGGLDSSTIVCLMARRLGSASTPMCFSSCHADPRFDERPYIHAVRAQTGAVGHEVFPDPARLWQELPDLLYHQDEPFAGTSIMAQWSVMKEAGQAGAKVLLDGQGADELLLGYPRFAGLQMADLVRTGRWGRAYAEWTAWGRLHGGVSSSVRAGLIRGLLPRAPYAWLRAMATGQKEWLAPSFLRRSREQSGTAAHPYADSRSVLQTHMAETLSRDLPALLHSEDRNAMAFSIEARVPFLDHRLVEWLARVPPEVNLRDGLTKTLLREAMAGVLPEPVRCRTDKMGFVTPEDEWLREPWRPQIEALFASDRFRSRPYWRAAAIRDHYDRYCRHKAGNGPVVWRWVNVELWLRRFCD